MPEISLKTRIVIMTALVVLLVAAPTQFIVASTFARYQKRAMISQQFSFVSQIANRMNEDITQAQQALQAEARLITPKLLQNPIAARKFLQDRRSLKTVFDYGLFIFSASGIELAMSNYSPQHQFLDCSSLPYFRETITRKLPYVSEPYISARADFHPVVMFTVPILDANDKVIAVFAGGIDLHQKNILARPAGVQIGQTGYLAVYTPSGVIVTHTDPKKILASFNQETLALMQTGAEAGIETKDFRGVPVLMTRQIIPATGWTLASCYPTAELYAPLTAAKRTGYMVVAGGVLLSCLLTGFLARYLTRSLTELTTQVTTIAIDLDTAHRVQLKQHDETGQLAAAINRMLEALDTSRRELAKLTAELSISEERERHRIASDLHDSICQSLAVANMQLGQVGAALGDPTLQKTVTTVRGILETSVADMRTLIFDLSPPILYELGLRPAVEWYADTFAAKHALTITVAGDHLPRTSRSDLDIFLFRAVRELLVNIHKHAAAQAVSISFRHEQKTLRIVVNDDGKGFVANASRERTDASGFGLFSIRERLRQLGGSLEIDSTPDAGTRLTLHAPNYLGHD